MTSPPRVARSGRAPQRGEDACLPIGVHGHVEGGPAHAVHTERIAQLRDDGVEQVEIDVRDRLVEPRPRAMSQP
ncbi:hypothetical protein GS497_26245 [Rhodococcus hoagii]|nr:hypothetical protein [Prescottella equi]